MFNVIRDIPSPETFKREIPLPEALKAVKARRDSMIYSIFTGASDKFLLIIGPCSADNADAVCDYITRVSRVQEKVADKLVIVPRIYTNKPRTNGRGYKGMLHQPDPREKEDLFAGITAMRGLHIRAIEESGLTSADEMLYPENFLFLDDLLSYHAIGARSAENQQHRLTASGIDAPVGMKNPTSGDLTVMFNSIFAAQSGHVFLYRLQEVETMGNPLAHGIMRGSVNKHGDSIPNYHYEDLIRVYNMYESYGLANPAIIVDVNHNNSGKRFGEQPRISMEIMRNRRHSPQLHSLVKGLMIESYIVEGSQSPSETVYGKSITDGCLGWEDSERLIYDLADML